MTSLDYTSLANSKSYYEKTQLFRLLLISRKSKKSRLVQDSKLKMFFCLRLIVIKNIENFFSLADKTGMDIFHTRDDMVCEFYITMENCVNKFDIRKDALFYWYYNRALSLRSIRILDECYHKHSSTMRVEGAFEDYFFSGNGVQISVDFLDFHLDQFGITEQEKLLIDAKFRKKTVNDFIESVEGMTQTKYFDLLSSIKKKLIPLRDENSKFSLGS